LGESEFVLAGGSESASQCPVLILRDYEGSHKEGEKEYIDSLFYDGLQCRMTKKRMGELVERLAKKYKINRKAQDDYSFTSHQKAHLAQRNNMLSQEVTAVRADKDAMVKKDEHPFKVLDREMFDGFPSAFSEKGSVTAGNASAPCDGAALVGLASPAFVKKNRLKPKAKVLGYVSVMVDPQRTFESDTVAIRKVLKKCSLTLKDIDIFEIAEAFAAQIIHTKKALRLPEEKVNPLGGDIALGHPLGTAGARVLVTLVNTLHSFDKKIGLACISYGGGGATAMVIERN